MNRSDELTIGLDIGIGSCGWAVINDSQRRIEDIGVRIYSSGEEGVTKSEDRASQKARSYRSRRRLNRRNKQRKKTLKKYLEEINFITKEEIDNAFTNHENNNNVIKLRVSALDSKISKIDIVSILINMCNYRGYKDFYDDVENDKKSKLEDAKNKIEKLFDKNIYRTIGELIYKNSTFINDINNGFSNYRNNEEYKYLFSRYDLIDETTLILNKQSEFYSELKDSIKTINEIIFSQRDFEDGPGPANKDSELAMFESSKGQRVYQGFSSQIGNCTFYNSEKKGNKNSLIYDAFCLVNDLSTMTFYSKKTGEIFNDYRSIFNHVFNELIKNDGEYEIRNFKKYLKNQNIEVNCKNQKKKFGKYKYISFLFNKEIFPEKYINAFLQDAQNNNYFNDDCLSNKLGEIMTQDITPSRRKEKVKALLSELNDNQLKTISVYKLSEVARLSNKYMIQAIEAFLNGTKYGNFQAEFIKMNETQNELVFVKDGNLIPINDADLMRNPVVYKSINETRKVLNALLKKYKNIKQINIEVAREVGSSFEQRKNIEDLQKENQKRKLNNEEKLYDLLLTHNYEDKRVTNKMLEKYVLWESQNHKCLYTGEEISFSSIATSDNTVQVDHIIPQSIILDDTLANKVLVKTNANSKKNNRIPMECMGSEPFLDVNEYKKNINHLSNKLPKKKIEYLLLEELTDEIIQGFVSRNINDTRYITRYITNYLKSATKQLNRNIKINALNGSVTSRFRKKWLTEYKDGGLVPSVYSLDDKGRDLHYYHHCVDAVIIANLEPKYIVLANSFDRIKSIEKDKNLTDDIKESEVELTINNTVNSLKKYYGLSEEYVKSLLKKSYVPSKCINLKQQVEAIVPLDIKFKNNLSPFIYNKDCIDFKKLKFYFNELKKAKENQEEIEELKEQATKLIEKLRINKSVSVIIAMDSKEFNKLEPQLVDYIDSINILPLDQYKDKLVNVFGKEFAEEFEYPYVSYRVDRRYRGNFLRSDNIVSLEKVNNDYKKSNFDSIEDLMSFINSEEGIKCPYYVKWIDKNKNNYSIYLCGYYCLEVFENRNGKAEIRGIKYTDIKKKNGKLYLLSQLPVGYKHIMYLFQNEYIEIRNKKGILKNNGFGAFRSAENVNQNSIKIRLLSNKNLSGKDTYISIDKNITKFEVDILGKLKGEIKCGDQLLFMNPNE